MCSRVSYADCLGYACQWWNNLMESVSTWRLQGDHADCRAELANDEATSSKTELPAAKNDVRWNDCIGRNSGMNISAVIVENNELYQIFCVDFFEFFVFVSSRVYNYLSWQYATFRTLWQWQRRWNAFSPTWFVQSVPVIAKKLNSFILWNKSRQVKDTFTCISVFGRFQKQKNQAKLHGNTSFQ